MIQTNLLYDQWITMAKDDYQGAKSLQTLGYDPYTVCALHYQAIRNSLQGYILLREGTLYPEKSLSELCLQASLGHPELMSYYDRCQQLDDFPQVQNCKGKTPCVCQDEMGRFEDLARGILEVVNQGIATTLQIE